MFRGGLASFEASVSKRTRVCEVLMRVQSYVLTYLVTPCTWQGLRGRSCSSPALSAQVTCGKASVYKEFDLSLSPSLGRIVILRDPLHFRFLYF